MTIALLDRYLEVGFLRLEKVFDDGEVASAVEMVRHLPDWIRQRSADRNIQRVQPLQNCPAMGNPEWIRAFYDNAVLDRTLAALFGHCIDPPPRMSRDRQITALLIEPLDNWWSTGLHRDYRDFVDGLDIAYWKAKALDPRLFNQINIPLFPDASLWFIPGSHHRDDFKAEAHMVASRSRYAGCRTAPPDAAEQDARRRELVDGLRRCGAVRLEAEPGDFIIYRSNMLHCGVYEPGKRRLTLHDAVYSSEWHQYAVDTFRPHRTRPATRDADESAGS